MFSKLIFTVDEDEIELNLHEIVHIAQSLLTSSPGRKVRIHSPEYLNFIFDDMAKVGSFAHAAKDSTLDPLLFVPYHVSPKDSPWQWLFVAKYFGENHDKSQLKGWWLLIAKRLLLVKNEKTYPFYVSDHGFLNDIITNVKEIAFEPPWVRHMELIEVFIPFRNALRDLADNPEGLRQYKQDFLDGLNNASAEEIKLYHPEKTEEEIQSILEDIRSNPDRREFEWQKLQDIVQYWINIVFRKYYELKTAKETFDFDVLVFNLYGYNEISENIIKRIVFARIAKEVNQGLVQPLFRPCFSYGDAEAGDAYHKFAQSIFKYFTRPNAWTPKKLAQAAREILEGKDANIDDETSFLPNLIAAWFIGEGARNPVSVLTSMMLLDMIENDIILVRDEQNLYSWEYAVVHPKNDEYSQDKSIRVKDFYGYPVTPYEMGGSHPMAHSGSQSHGKNLVVKRGKNTYLNVARQKEGGLILHWLYTHLRIFGKNFSVKLIDIDQKPLEINPKFNNKPLTLDEIEEKIKKTQGTIRVKKSKQKNIDDELQTIDQLIKLRKKQQIVKFLIEPLLIARMDSVSNLLIDINLNQTISDIFKRFYEIFQLNKDQYDFDEESVPSTGNCLFEAVLLGACRIYRKLIPDDINTPTKLRKCIFEELLSNQTHYRAQVSHSIRDILYSALESNDEFYGVAESFQVILRPLLSNLKYHKHFERKFLEDANALSQKISHSSTEGDKKHLSEKLFKLRKIQQEWDQAWQIYFDNTVLKIGYKAYYENLLVDTSWGGQLELEILAKLLKIRIEIYNDNIVINERTFTVKKVSGCSCKVGYSYTVNDDRLPSIHLFHTGNSHYNFLNPTKHGLSHYLQQRSLRFPVLPLLQREYELQKSYNEELILFLYKNVNKSNFPEDKSLNQSKGKPFKMDTRH